jgi:hypothetical protein
MNVMQNLKFAKSIVPQSINGTDTNGTTVDCRGFHYATAVCHFGAIGAATFDKLEIQESDNDSNWSVVTGTTFTAPGDTDDDKFYQCSIDLRKRKRYLRWSYDPGAAATLGTAFFILSNPDEHPNTVAEKGVAEHLIV